MHLYPKILVIDDDKKLYTIFSHILMSV